MMENLHDIVTAYVIWWFAWAVRYVASTLGWKIKFNIWKLFAFIFVCWWFWIFAYRVETIIKDYYWRPDMIVPIWTYLAWMLSKETIEVLIVKRPNLFAKKIDNLWNQL